jgi:hypothetical protein
MYRHIAFILLFALSDALPAQEVEKSKPRILRQWMLSSDYMEEIAIPFDTVFSLFNHFMVTDIYSPFNAYTGNYGLPLYQIAFFDRIIDPDKFLYRNYYPFMHLPEKAIFTDTQRPFTELLWTFGGPRATSEQTFRVRHSQNVNRFFNIGLSYDIIFSLGKYMYQRSENKNFKLYSSYTGEKYKAYFSAGINNITSFENGGVTDMGRLREFSNPRDLPVNLGGLNLAKSSLKNRNILLVQRYTLKRSPVQGNVDTLKQKEFKPFGVSGTFSHIFIWENNRKDYSDNSARSGFYDTAYINQDITFDSLSQRSFKNTVRFDFITDTTRKFRLGGGAGIRNEMFRYSQIMPTFGDPAADTSVWHRSSNALTGRLYNDIGDKFRWSAMGELYLSGFKAGDFNLKGELTKGFDWKRSRAEWVISGGITSSSPAFWHKQWGSNHFVWNNDFNKEFRIKAGTDFSYPGRNIWLKADYAIIDNYTDIGPGAMPSQHTGGLSVAAISVRKNFRAWKLHLDNVFLVQKSSNDEVLDLPLFTGRSTGYFEHNFIFKSTNGNLNTQLGAEVFYHTEYNPYAYMPSTGVYYRQGDITAGNYPFINVFLNLKIRRTRLFLMFDHVNSGMMGYDYFLVPSYPVNARMFRYGLAWTFYD